MTPQEILVKLATSNNGKPDKIQIRQMADEYFEKEFGSQYRTSIKVYIPISLLDNLEVKK